MGAPIFALPAEVCLQYMEHNLIWNMLKEHQISVYFKHVDDLPVCYKYRLCSDRLQFYTALYQMYNRTRENNHLNFLDISTTNNNNGLQYDVCRNPTATDAIRPCNSCYPEHNRAAIIYIINRMIIYRLSTLHIHMGM